MDFNQRSEVANRLTAAINEAQIPVTITAVKGQRGGFMAVISNNDIPRFEEIARSVLTGYVRTGHRTTPNMTTASLYFDGTGLANAE